MMEDIMKYCIQSPKSYNVTIATAQGAVGEKFNELLHYAEN